MKKIFTVLGTCFLIASANNAHAQTQASDDQISNMNLVDVITISVAPGAGGADATFDQVSEYVNGIENLLAVQATVSSTQNFDLNVQTTTADFTGGVSVIPSTVLMAKPAGAGSYVGLSTTSLNLYTNQSYGDNVSLAMDYKFVPGLSGYVAGTYSITATYTAVQQWELLIFEKVGL